MRTPMDLTDSGADHTSGTCNLAFTGSDCGCFGGLGTVRMDQRFPSPRAGEAER